jgi:hypothetical protein
MAGYNAEQAIVNRLFCLLRYASQTGAYENAVSSAIVDYKKVKKLDGKLRPIKVFR